MKIYLRLELLSDKGCEYYKTLFCRGDKETAEHIAKN